MQEYEVGLLGRLPDEQQQSYATAMGHLSNLCAHAKAEGVSEWAGE